MDALRSFRYPMVRQVNEGARVRISRAQICMNSKSEFHLPGIVRVVAVSLLAGRVGRGRGVTRRPGTSRGRAARSRGSAR